MLDTEVLVRAAQLFDPRIEDHEVVDDVQEARLFKHQPHLLVEAILSRVKRHPILLPTEEEPLWCFDGAILQALAVVAGNHQLHRREEGRNEPALLVAQVLPNGVGDVHPRPLEFHDAQRDAIDVQHNVRALRGLRMNRHLLSHRKVVRFRILPVDEAYRHIRLILQGDIDPVPQPLVHFLVGLVKVIAGPHTRLPGELGHCSGHDVRSVFPPRSQPVLEVILPNVAVGLVLQIAQVAVPHRLEQNHDPVLGLSFETYAHASLILPVNNNCINPLFFAFSFTDNFFAAAI